MASTNDATINAFYLAYYGRPADPAGLAYWSQALATSNGDFSSIVNAFSTSAEATAHIGTGTATDQISNVYQQLFGHAPDAAGLAYWADAVSSGNMTLAEAAIQITNGAQTSDLTVSTLRQEVAAQFTATVAASGVAYDGEASNAAARVMISAVNATSSATDIQSLITAGASLAQTAHDNPAIITALANGGDLSTLLSTTSGQSDPVGLIQALASIGKAALTDSAGLTALLHGGGVAGLLASLPAGTTIKDVAAAVDTGGLAAGTTVATTPVDTTVTITIMPTIAFSGIDGKDLPTDTTLVANSIYYFVDLHGKPSGATTTFQVSATGAANDWKTVSEDDDLPDGTYFIRYIVSDKAGNSGTSNTLKLVMDHSVDYPTVQLAADTGLANDRVTSNGAVNISGLHANETWSYSFDGKTWTTGTTDSQGMGTVTATTEGNEHLQIRTLENVDGQSQFTSTLFTYTFDKTAPAAPTVVLTHDTGTSATDHITNDSTVTVSGLENGSTWQYSIDGGAHWVGAFGVDANGVATFNPYTYGATSVEVRSTDASGNVGATSTLNFTVELYANGSLQIGGYDKTEVTTNDAGLTFSTRAYNGGADITSVYEVSTSGLEGTFTAWTPATKLADGDYYFRAELSDSAGNTEPTNVITVHLDNTAPAAPTSVALVADTGISGDGITSNGNFIVSGLAVGQQWEYSSDGTHWFTGTSVAPDGTAAGYAQASGLQTLQVRAVDLAGNASASTSVTFTLDTHTPADGLALNHIDYTNQNGSGTSLTHADVVFSYTGTVASGDVLTYNLDNTDQAQSITIDKVDIDTVAKTVTLHDIDLSQGDPYVTIHTTDVAGANYTFQTVVDGPVTHYFTTGSSANGLGLYAENGQFYVTETGSAVVELQTTAATYGSVLVGPQTSVVEGVLGAGETPDALTTNTSDAQYGNGTMGFGTTGNDTISGSHVWGYDGNDTITAVTSSDAYRSTIYGGLGADQIHMETTASELFYDSAQESFVAADSTLAHGFDTVFLGASSTANLSATFNLEHVTLGNNQFQISGTALGYTGAETGTALLSMLNTAVADQFVAGQGGEMALINMGGGVNFLVVDANADGVVDSTDYVVQIVGADNSVSLASFTYNTGYITVHSVPQP